MEFPDYYQRLIDNRDGIIEYYVHQYGEDTRQMFEERFDRIRFCFFVTPEAIKNYIDKEITRVYALETISFMKEIGFDNIENARLTGNGEVVYNDLLTDTVIESFFPKTKNIGIFLDNTELEQGGIWLFLSDETLQNEGANHYNKEDISKRKLDFFNKILIVEPGEVITVDRFRELNTHFEEIAEDALMHRKIAQRSFNDLIKFADELEKKAQMARNDEEKAKVYMIGGNYEIDDTSLEEMNRGVMQNEQYTTAVINGKELKEVNIFFCPFIGKIQDLYLRHELRHALTMSFKTLENETRELKTGNFIVDFNKKGERKEHLREYNEWITQLEAINETKKAFEEGIFIVDQEGTMIFDDEFNTYYDEYLPIFRLVYDSIPENIKISQIADSNDSLYESISLDKLEKLEEIIMNFPDRQEETIKRLGVYIQRLKKQEMSQLMIAKRRRDLAKKENSGLKRFLEELDKKIKAYGREE